MVLNNDNSKTRAFVDHCYRTTSVMVNPIVDWSDKDVWEFLYYYGIKSNPLYEVEDTGKTFCPRGNSRIGCIGCPMKGGAKMKAEFLKYPHYRDNYLRAFDSMMKARKAAGLENIGVWYDARSVMMWWVGDDPRQLSLLGEPEYLKGACM